MTWYQAMPKAKTTNAFLNTSAGSRTMASKTPKPSAYTAPKPQVQQPVAPQPVQQAQSGGGGGFNMGGGYQPSWNFQMPGLPQEPQVSQDMIRQWQERAKQEAGMVYDPQVLAIQQELDKAILMASQSAGNIPGYYEDIISQIKQWQTDETKNMQQRYFARGLGRGGGLIQEEGKLAETALKEMTTAETEKARKLGDIDAQKQQLTEQAGAKITGAETAEGQYIASRAADLQDSYTSQKQQLEQQKFQNQMAIQQFGLTAETQQFNQWLSSMEASADIWYNNQQMALAQESARISGLAKGGSGSSDSSGGSNPGNRLTGKQNTAIDKAVGTVVKTSQKSKKALDAWDTEQIYTIPTYSADGMQMTRVDKKTFSDWANSMNYGLGR